ncbi:MAG: class I SAM-dependent methyltransferase [Elusimicrobia bacterium]|nr:class I SAM-dependent methyltransferase [Elusimicrobiota bacterium]
MSDEPLSSWERLYHMLEPEKLPWDAGKPDEELVKLVDSGFLAPGPALDVGSGLGHDAVFLAAKGFQVTAVDISATAVKLAQERAQAAEVKDKIDFQATDVLRMEAAPGRFSLINDRGFFHYLRDDSRAAYIGFLRRSLSDRGLVFLRVYSDKEPPCLGPLRYSMEELKRLFERAFDIEGLKESVFEGASKAKSLVALLRKKAA